jgi:alternative ribosome-rescue factor
MSKKSKRHDFLAGTHEGAVETGRGQVKHNFLAALVTSSVYHQRIVRAKKGKGAYRRTNKDKGAESYLIAA